MERRTIEIIKRNKSRVPFEKSKITDAIMKASCEVEKLNPKEAITKQNADIIANRLYQRYKKRKYPISVEDVQNDVILELQKSGYYVLAQRYIIYRNNHSLIRQSNTTDKAILEIIEAQNKDVSSENANKDAEILSTQRDYVAGEVSKDVTTRIILPKDIVDAHIQGLLHFHDSDYFMQHMHNCDLVNLEDMLQNGTVITDTMIEKPHEFSTACNIATQIIAQVASSQYGGQSISLAHLAPFVDVSRNKFRDKVREEGKLAGIEYTDNQVETIVKERLKGEISKGIQTIQYQIVTLMTTNGQAPFVTVYMALDEAKTEREREDLALLIEETLKQRIKGVKNKDGVWVTPVFPKLIYLLDESNVYEGSPYYYLTELAAKCAAKRMVPDFISKKVMIENKGDVYTCMGCRSFLTPDRFTDKGIENPSKSKNYIPGKHKYYGRFNQGVVTINLVDVACSSGGDMSHFWEIFDERLELCHKALKYRHKRLLGTKSDVAPILWQYGALARFERGEVIDPLLFNGYSTISLGYAGLYECTKYMTGESHTKEGMPKEFALSVMKHMNDACNKWKEEENIDYSIYGTPMESTTYKFAKCLQKRFGKIPGVTDRNYITNSYHVHVTEEIDAFSKLKFEAEFQALSPGGAISYVEIPNMQHNIPAVIKLIQFIYENIMYAELNTKSDYCSNCGYEGEIPMVKGDSDEFIWKCPQCSNTDQRKLHCVRRVCGYLFDSARGANAGRKECIHDRVLHL